MMRDKRGANVRVFEDLEALSRAAAEEFSNLAKQKAGAGTAFTAALSGGSTPKEFYQLLATPEFSATTPWLNIHLFQVDERCVPADSPQSNYKMIREAMLDQIPMALSNFHRIPAEEADRESASDRYAADLRRTVGASQAQWPQLDLLYLGMGDDGHTASLFPGTAALEENTRAVCPNWVEKLSMWRITLTRPVLNAAARVIFMVSGAQKAEMLRQVLQDVRDSPRFPAQLIHPENGTLAWYLDRSAASLLSS
ncbi:MAG: 6-phosphogluconolactonase [Terriglobia bacterium]